MGAKKIYFPNKFLCNVDCNILQNIMDYKKISESFHEDTCLCAN